MKSEAVNVKKNKKDIFLKKLLSKKHILVVLFFVLVATYMNNYFFFKHAARDIDRDIIHRAKDIKAFSTYCMKNNSNNQDKCVKDLGFFLNETPLYYGARYIIKDENNNTILKAGHMSALDGRNDAYTLSYIQNNLEHVRYEKLFRKMNISNDDIQKLTSIKEINATMEIKKYAIPTAIIASFRSLTFSVSDWVPKIFQGKYKEAIDDVVHTAFPRSWATILFIFMGWFLYRFFKYEERVHENELKIADNKLLDVLQKKHVGPIGNDLEEYHTIIDKVIPTNQLLGFVKTYPQGVVSECRRIGEMLSGMLDSDCRGTQAEKINCLSKKGIIDDMTKNNLHTIRVLGNTAMHNPEIAIKKNEALIVLHALVSIFKSPNIKY